MCDMPACWRERGARERGSEREADLRASEGGLRGRLREHPKSGQWTPRKRSSDERSGGLCRVEAWRLPPRAEPISGGVGRVRDGSGTGKVHALFWASFWDSFWTHPGGHFGAHLGAHLGIVLDPSWRSFWSSFGSSFGIILEVILEVTLETCWNTPLWCDGVPQNGPMGRGPGRPSSPTH